jgi:hypothetical protein
MEVNEKTKGAYVCKVIYMYLWHLMHLTYRCCFLNGSVQRDVCFWCGQIHFEGHWKGLSQIPRRTDGSITEGRTVSGQKVRRNDRRTERHKKSQTVRRFRRTERHIVRQSGRSASSLQQIFHCFNSNSRKNGCGISVLMQSFSRWFDINKFTELKTVFVSDFIGVNTVYVLRCLVEFQHFLCHSS